MSKYFLNGYHDCSGDWAIQGKELKIPVQDLFRSAEELRVVPLDQICSRPLSKFRLRFKKADTRFPCILADAENPCGLKYRLVDGRHRFRKLKDSGETDGVFFIITKEAFRRLYEQ